MNKLRYKDFAFSRNPHTYREEYIREPQYVTEDKVTTFTGMGEMKRILTGEGVFSGTGAIGEFRTLAALFEDKTAGYLSHPVWGMRYCYFTGLEMKQEPRENHVSYRFQFTCADSNGKVPK